MFLCLFPLPSPEPLRVTLSPKNLKTGISSTVILSCAVQGSPHFTVSWYRNTEPVLPDQHFSIQGAHNETLFISAAQKRHSGAYQCFATRKGQTAQDFSIILLEGEHRWVVPWWYIQCMYVCLPFICISTQCSGDVKEAEN